MNAKKQLCFYQYIFEKQYPYVVNEIAVSDGECYEFAKQIVALWDKFNLEHPNPTKVEMTEQLTEYLNVLISELDENSPLINNVRIALRNEMKNNSERTDVYDHLLRIRAVFGL